MYNVVVCHHRHIDDMMIFEKSLVHLKMQVTRVSAASCVDIYFSVLSCCMYVMGLKILGNLKLFFNYSL